MWAILIQLLSSTWALTSFLLSFLSTDGMWLIPTTLRLSARRSCHLLHCLLAGRKRLTTWGGLTMSTTTTEPRNGTDQVWCKWHCSALSCLWVCAKVKENTLFSSVETIDKVFFKNASTGISGLLSFKLEWLILRRSSSAFLCLC